MGSSADGIAADRGLAADRKGRKAARRILGVQIDALDYDGATEEILRAATAGESVYVCAANVHVVMEAHRSPSFRQAVEASHLAVPDGMPLVWGLRRLGVEGASRVYGPELMVRVLGAAEARSIPVGLYGARPDVLDRVVERVRVRFPDLRLVYSESPPFRELSPGEDDQVMERINASGARILFVALGCPKQERWMAAQHGKGPVVMLGVGAAFSFFAGTTPQAPAWVQDIGLEWVFRLATEPRRLWKRYLTTVPPFLLLFGRQMLTPSKGQNSERG